LYSSPKKIRMSEPIKMKWAGHVVGMGQKIIKGALREI
jgi:hypothetical protein